MRRGAWKSVVQHVDRLYAEGTSSGWADDQLLSRFATAREESDLAFEAIVRRHGPMVLQDVPPRAGRRPSRRRRRLPGDVPGPGSPGRIDRRATAWLARPLAPSGRLPHGPERPRGGRTPRGPRAPRGRRGHSRLRTRSFRLRPRRRMPHPPRGGQPAAGEVPRGGGPVLFRGRDARSGGRIAALAGGYRPRLPGPGARPAADPADPPRPGPGGGGGRAGPSVSFGRDDGGSGSGGCRHRGRLEGDDPDGYRRPDPIDDAGSVRRAASASPGVPAGCGARNRWRGPDGILPPEIGTSSRSSGTNGAEVGRVEPGRTPRETCFPKASRLESGQRASTMGLRSLPSSIRPTVRSWPRPGRTASSGSGTL